MNGVVLALITSLSTISAAALGFWSSYLIQRKSQKQKLIDSILGKRMSTYSEALNFVYQIEQNQAKADALDKIVDGWKKWYPSNAAYLPPSVNAAFFGAMIWAVPVSVDLHNAQVNIKTTSRFIEFVQDAKTKLLGLEDIGWLPEDLK
jgi:hypothetical protein